MKRIQVSKKKSKWKHISTEYICNHLEQTTGDSCLITEPTDDKEKNEFFFLKDVVLSSVNTGYFSST